jgi:glycosyltransferase involved in cell wall biosynthesis
MASSVSSRGYPSNRIAIIPNGADIKDFQARNADDLEARHPWLKDKKLVVYVGTVGLVNGVDYVPKVASALKKMAPETKIRFVVIGDGKCLDDVKTLSLELGVLNSLVYFVGKVPKREVPAWLAKCDATIMTCNGPEILFRDAVFNKFFDSLAAGKPVFANFRGFSSVVAASAGAGMILPSHDIDTAAKLLSKSLHDDVWLNKAAEASLELGKRFFDRDRLAQDLERVLLAAVASKGFRRAEPVGNIFADLWERALTYTRE